MVIDKNFWNSKKVLLTGHTGFKGSWMMLCLQELGAEVWGYSLAPDDKANLFKDLIKLRPPNQSEEVKFWVHKESDIRNYKQLENFVQECQPDIIFHFAAQPLVRRSYKDPLETWTTNVIGSMNLLEASKRLKNKCSIVMITTDKVYENKEWNFGYREVDPLGGHDPYSSSKAACEIAISSWRSSFCGSLSYQNNNLRIASARSGNVIGGGDWAEDRIVPDSIRSLMSNEPIKIRNPKSTRPWQHVLDPLSGYLLLAENIYRDKDNFCEAFNFGPNIESNRTVLELVNEIKKYWPGKSIHISESENVHEAGLLNLQIDKAFHLLKWKPNWDFHETVFRTTNWYMKRSKGISSLKCCLDDLYEFFEIN